MAGRVPYSRSALGHYETGRRTPTAEVVLWYEQICGEASDPVTAAATLGRADVDRRSFIRKAMYSVGLSATALSPAVDLGRLAHAGEGAKTSMAEVDAVRAVTDAFLRLDEAKGGGTGRTATAEFLATDVAALLRSRFADEHARTGAYSAAAELAYLIGFKSHDAGREGLAQRYYLSSLRLAEESGMSGQDGFALRILAIQGSDVGQRKFSVPLAEKSLERIKGKVGPDTYALFQTALARCQAETGDHQGARRALQAAEPAIHAASIGPMPRWAAQWCDTRASLVNQSAKAFLALGETAEAEQRYTLAASMWNRDTHPRVFALTSADAGHARWRMGDEAGAAEAWNQIVPTLQDIDSARTSAALDRIRRKAPELV